MCYNHLVPEKDKAHWLYRLDAGEWLAAAEGELGAARRAAIAKQHRAAVVQARRAAGMALNALLWAGPDEAYGRSYVEHLRALAADGTVRDDVRKAALRLLDMSLQQEVVQLGRGTTSIADPAALIIEYVRALLLPPARA